ncbi:hypothetical protein [Nostoc sp.]|uniref:hypothetical protein n=1 Tax=Nostoc sp. TaxID=1180 RepID=UPI002FF4D007
MNIQNLDSFFTELSEEELKSCNGGSLGKPLDGAGDATGQTVNNTLDTTKYTVDGAKDAVILITGPLIKFLGA